jgi:ubiquitin carboxyl-terminal hydrolase 22/27/51
MEISKCGLYCGQCKDFVYDRDFDGIHNSEVLRNSEIISMVQGTRQLAHFIINDEIKSRSECLTDMFHHFYITEPGQKRPRFSKWHAGNKEAALIKAGSKLQACQGIPMPHFYDVSMLKKDIS